MALPDLAVEGTENDGGVQMEYESGKIIFLGAAVLEHFVFLFTGERSVFISFTKTNHTASQPSNDSTFRYEMVSNPQCSSPRPQAWVVVQPANDPRSFPVDGSTWLMAALGAKLALCIRFINVWNYSYVDGWIK